MNLLEKLWKFAAAVGVLVTLLAAIITIIAFVSPQTIQPVVVSLYPPISEPEVIVTVETIVVTATVNKNSDESPRDIAPELTEPSSAASSLPTNTPTSTPVPTPLAVSDLTILDSDLFDAVDSRWVFPVYENYTYNNGQLILKCTFGQGGCATSSGADSVYSQDVAMSFARSFQIFDDFILDLDAEWIRGARGASYGVYFRYQDINNFYEFTIEPSRRYTIARMTSGTYTLLHDNVLAESINLHGETNHLRVEAKGDSLKFFINDVFVAQVIDNEINRGDVVFVMKFPPGSNDELEVGFDNYAVHVHP